MERVRVETSSGVLEGGREADDFVAFRGVPYAAPPLGNLRWRPAQPTAPWSGVRDATSFEPNSMQPPPDAQSSVPGDPAEQSEDCLYLNVYTPACDGGGRPVMVWIHGGGFVSGSASSALYAGEHLVRQGVVLVTLNYRLGALGFLAHPALADPSDAAVGFGNWGLGDQIAALEWVASNIAAFGGDPALVTVFGESAGAMSVAALMASSASQRLFRRAIMQSGSALALGEGTGIRVAEELAGELGLEEITREALVAIPATELLRAQMAIGPRYEILGLPFQPVVDDGLLTQHPATAIAGGSAQGIDLLIGTNRDEWQFWTWSNPELREIDEERLLRLVTRQIENAGVSDTLDPAGTIDTHRQSRLSRGQSAGPPDVYSAIVTDWTFRVPSMRLAAGHHGGLGNVFAYHFDWESPFAGGVLGACHALDLPFVFGSCANPFIAVFSGGGPEAERLSSTMRSAWAAFATTGDPATDESGDWPQYETARRATKRLGPVVEVIDAPMEPERAWLDGALGPYGEIEAHLAERVRVPGRAR